MRPLTLLLLALHALGGRGFHESPIAEDAAPLARAVAVAVPTAPVTDQRADASWILPGAFSERTTVADLQARFGEANVQIPDPADRDASASSGVVLFPDDPTRRAFVFFHDNQNLSGLANISVRDAGSQWRGKHGVHVGMSFADLRRANGKPFYFTGFDSDGRAWVHDQWSPALDDDGPMLGRLDAEAGEHMYFAVQLGLRAGVEATAGTDYPGGEESHLSDDPRFPRLAGIAEVTEFNAFTSLDDEWE